MKIETPLHTEHQLDGQFEHWRQTRSHPTPCIPQGIFASHLQSYTALA